MTEENSDSFEYTPSEPARGDIAVFETISIPRRLGWVPCAGQTYNISEHPDLYSAISEVFEHTETTFTVPDLVTLGTEGFSYLIYIGV